MDDSPRVDLAGVRSKLGEPDEATTGKITDFLDENDVPGSCLRGICGSCALRVLDGTPEHRDSLNADDSSTTIYPCVSRSVTPRLVVEA